MKIAPIFKAVVVSLLVSISAAVQADTVLHTDKGPALSSAQLEHKWVILNVWASWCDTCKEEMPELNKFYKTDLTPNVAFYGVNYDRLTGAELASATKSLDIQFPILLEDPATLWKLGSLEFLPVTYIINPKGEVVKKITGANTEKSLLAELKVLQAKA